MIYCLCLICLEVAMNILIPFGNYCQGWQQLRKAVRVERRLPADRTPACMPTAVAVRLLEQWKFIVICCSNKKNAVCIPRNFWKSQQTCSWHLQPVKQMLRFVLEELVLSGEVRQKPPEGCPALPAGGSQLLVVLRCLAAPCPCSEPAAAMGQLGQLGDGQGITLWARTYTYLAASVELLQLMWGTTSVRCRDVSKCLTDFCFNDNKKKAAFDIILSELLIQSAVTPVCYAQHAAWIKCQKELRWCLWKVTSFP